MRGLESVPSVLQVSSPGHQGSIDEAEDAWSVRQSESNEGVGMRRLAILVATFALSLIMAVPAGAHTQTVTPPSKGEPIVQGPISNAWAQAHCNAQAPAVTGEASGGVVQFNPQGALPCPATPNPGGQVHPHAGG